MKDGLIIMLNKITEAWLSSRVCFRVTKHRNSYIVQLQLLANNVMESEETPFRCRNQEPDSEGKHQ